MVRYPPSGMLLSAIASWQVAKGVFGFLRGGG